MEKIVQKIGSGKRDKDGTRLTGQSIIGGTRWSKKRDAGVFEEKMGGE